MDVGPDVYADLKRLADAAANELGVLRVAHQEITSTLVRLYVQHPELQRQVLDKIREGRRPR